MKIRVLSLFVALFATTSLWAYDFASGDLCYNITSERDKTVEVTYQNDRNSFRRNYYDPLAELS